MAPSKSVLVTLWHAHLTDLRAALLASQQGARAGTRVDGVHRPATRGERAAVTSQGYLALGLGQRVEAIEQHLFTMTRMGDGHRSQAVVGAMIGLQDVDKPIEWLALLPGGDATTISVEGTEVRVLSAQSPLARQLRELECGDVVELVRNGVPVELELVHIG